MLYSSTWVAEYLKVHSGFNDFIASLDLSVVSTLWGSSIITIGLVSLIKSIGFWPFNLSCGLCIMFDLSSLLGSSKLFLNASIFIIIISIVLDVAKLLTWSSLDESYIK